MSPVMQVATAAPELKIARGFSLPLDLVTRKTAILAKSGAGKSNTGKVIVEGVLNVGAQVVVIDPVGHWWGLRSLFPIPVLGGMNGDIPLDPLAGKLIADVAAESGQSLILDVSLMDSDGEMQRFAYEFAERFYKQKQLHPTAVLIVLEEADEFAPQDTRGANVPRMVGAWARIAKRGRGRGIGLLSITLRSAALSKNVLNQSDGIIAMRTTAPLDIKAIEEWVKATRAAGADAVIPSLPRLETGEAWFWIPEYDVLERIKVSKARSLDTSATPEVGAAPAVAKELKPIDLAALGERMQATVERAKENDPAELRKRVRELERQLGERPGATAERVEVEVPVEVSVLTDEDRELLRKATMVLTPTVDAARAALGALRSLVERAEAASSSPAVPPRLQSDDSAKTRAGAGLTGGSRAAPASADRTARSGPEAAAESRVSGGGSMNGSLSSAEQRVLDALAWFEAMRINTPSRIQTGFVAGYKVSKKGGGTFAQIIADLTKKGLIEQGRGTVSLTHEGRVCADDPGLPTTNEALQRAVLSRLSEPEARILSVLIEVYPDDISRIDLGTQCGYTVTSKGGGAFAQLVANLVTLGLADKTRPGYVGALDVLFPLG